MLIVVKAGTEQERQNFGEIAKENLKEILGFPHTRE